MSVGLSFLPWLWRLVSVWFIPFVLITDIGLVASSVSLLQDFSRENSRRIKNLVLIWLVTGLLAFFAGAFR
jgi:4-hydroxybenzoate polyprenyltransferase